MAYKIQYTPQEEYRYPLVKRPTKWSRKITLLRLLAAAVILWIAVCGVPDFLIPGDPQVTKSAAAEMISLMKAGTPAYDAITVFCKQVIHGASL